MDHFHVEPPIVRWYGKPANMCHWIAVFSFTVINMKDIFDDWEKTIQDYTYNEKTYIEMKQIAN